MHLTQLNEDLADALVGLIRYEARALPADVQRPLDVGRFTTRKQNFLAFRREGVLPRSEFLEDA